MEESKGNHLADTAAKIASLQKSKIITCLPVNSEYELITKILEAKQLSIWKD